MLSTSGWTAKACLEAASASPLGPFSLVGVEFGGECFVRSFPLSLPPYSLLTVASCSPFNDKQAGNFTTAAAIEASLCSQQCNDAPTFSCGGSNALDLYLASALTAVPTTVPTRVQLDGSGDHTLSTEIGLPTPPPAAEEFKRRQRRSLQQL
jgi:hypothetical protein